MDTPMTDEKRHLTEIEAIQRDYDTAEQEWEQAKDKAAALKKIAEEKARKLFQRIRSLNAPMPLFDVRRQTPVAELGLSDGIVAILCEAGYDTVGKLADLTNRGLPLTSINHIGEQKAEVILRPWSDSGQTGRRMARCRSDCLPRRAGRNRRGGMRRGACRVAIGG